MVTRLYISIDCGFGVTHYTGAGVGGWGRGGIDGDGEEILEKRE